jgi:hypothetical protein
MKMRAEGQAFRPSHVPLQKCLIVKIRGHALVIADHPSTLLSVTVIIHFPITTVLVTQTGIIWADEGISPYFLFFAQSDLSIKSFAKALFSPSGSTKMILWNLSIAPS